MSSLSLTQGPRAQTRESYLLATAIYNQMAKQPKCPSQITVTHRHESPRILANKKTNDSK